MNENIEKLKQSCAEAKRFIKHADAAIKRLETDKFSASTKEFAQAKRSSLDLTRTLADLRKTQ